MHFGHKWKLMRIKHIRKSDAWSINLPATRCFYKCRVCNKVKVSDLKDFWEMDELL